MDNDYFDPRKELTASRALANIYASNESQQRIAKNLRVNKKTVVRKIQFLARRSRE